MKLVALPLAHPLTPEQVERIGGAAEVRMYRAGETIIVSPAVAMTIIRAGWAQVDPNDQRAVAATLAVAPPETPAAVSTPAAEAAAVTPAANAVTTPAGAPYGGGTDASGT